VPHITLWGLSKLYLRWRIIVKVELKTAATEKGGWATDFDQSNLNYYNDLCEGGETHKRTGLCLGLCSAWLYKLKNGESFEGYPQKEEGRVYVSTFVNRAQSGVGAWRTVLKEELQHVSLTQGYDTPGYTDATVASCLNSTNMPFGIIVVETGGGSHAVAARILTGWCSFFDPNEGAVIFTSEGSLREWFEIYMNAVLRKDYPGGTYTISGYN
jgi:hypothetical protein